MHPKGLDYGPPCIAQGDDQMPGEGRIVQSVVNAGEVGRLAAVDVEWRDRLSSGSLGGFPYLLQVSGVGDKAGVFIGAKVASLGVEGGSVGRFVASVPSWVEDDSVDRPK